MPSKSKSQARLMAAAAHTPGGYGGVPEKVGKEFNAADTGKNLDKLPKKVKKAKKDGGFGETMKNGFSKGGSAK